MADSSKGANDQRRGIFAGTLHIIALVLATYLGSLLLSIVVEGLGIYFLWWDEPGHLHAKTALVNELGWLNNDFKSMMLSPVEFATQVMNLTYYYLIKMTGFEWLVRQLQESVIFEYVLSMVYVIQVNAVRTAVIILSLPALMLLGLYAVIDGLTERDLRTWGLGHETSFVYHHAKNWIAPLFYFPILVYLSSPWSIHPSIFIVAFSIPFAYALWLVSMYFKKYV